MAVNNRERFRILRSMIYFLSVFRRPRRLCKWNCFRSRAPMYYPFHLLLPFPRFFKQNSTDILLAVGGGRIDPPGAPFLNEHPDCAIRNLTFALLHALIHPPNTYSCSELSGLYSIVLQHICLLRYRCTVMVELWTLSIVHWSMKVHLDISFVIFPCMCFN